MRAKIVRAAAVQLKPTADSVKKTIFQGVKLAKEAAEREAEIVCLPEHWLPEDVIPSPMDPLPGFQAIAEEYGVCVVAGAFFERVKGRIYLSSPVIGGDGDLLGRQFKVHLFRRERGIAKPGRSYEIFKIDGYKVGVLVCYDADFPEAGRVLTLKGADLLLCPSRIVREGVGPWRQYLTVRSLENRIPIVAPNVFSPPRFTGYSSIFTLKEDPATKIAHPRIGAMRRQRQGTIIDDVDLQLHGRLRRERFSDRRPETYA